MAQIRRITSATLLMGLVSTGCGPTSQNMSSHPPGTIYHAGKILSGPPSYEVVEAVAVTRGHIVAVGADEEILASAGPQTELVDLEGNHLLPGFYDNHVHLGANSGDLMDWKGGLISEVPDWVKGVHTPEALTAAIRGEAGRTPPGQWIMGALSREVWPNQNLPTRQDLDAGTTDHPVLLTRGPHTTVINTPALALAGITRTTTFPGGGEIGHDEDGEPNGRLYDSARRLVTDVAPSSGGPPPTVDQAVENMRGLMLQFASAGVTSVNVAGVRPDQLRLVQALYDRHGPELPRATVQVRLSPGYDTFDDLSEGAATSIRELESLGFITGFGDDRLKIGAVKMSIDGGLSAPVFWSLEPYESRPDFTGVVRIPAEAFYPVARRAHELGWQLGIHVMGDGAVEMVVDAMERILDEMPRENHRHYLHHVAVKPPLETIQTMARLGVGVASQPAFTVGLGAFAVEALAGEREATMNPTGSLLDAGVWVSWGSDGAPYGPRVSLWTGITRKGWDDRVYGPGEAVSRPKAIELHTLAPAYQTFDEEERGTIEVGKVADFVLLGGDLLSMAEDDIRSVPVLSTIVGGREIYRGSR